MTDPFATFDAQKRRAINARVSDRIIRQAEQCIPSEGAALLRELVDAGPDTVTAANRLAAELHESDPEIQADFWRGYAKGRSVR